MITLDQLQTFEVNATVHFRGFTRHSVDVMTDGNKKYASGGNDRFFEVEYCRAKGAWVYVKMSAAEVDAAAVAETIRRNTRGGVVYRGRNAGGPAIGSVAVAVHEAAATFGGLYGYAAFKVLLRNRVNTGEELDQWERSVVDRAAANLRVVVEDESQRMIPLNESFDDELTEAADYLGGSAYSQNCWDACCDRFGLNLQRV